MNNESQMLIEVCRLCGLRENNRPGQADAVFYYPDSQGKHNIDINDGQWFDFRSGEGGRSPVGLVIDVKGWGKRDAVDWLKGEGVLSESPTSRNVGRSARRSSRPTQRTTRAERPRTAQKPKPDNKKSDTQNFAIKLWGQSKQIGDNAEHPFRMWARSRNLLHPYCRVPPAIRWHNVRSLIVCGVFSLSAWGKDGTPFALPVAVEALAIDGQGNKRHVLGPNKNRDKCDYGPVSAGVFIIGDPTSERVNICEGVADALAVYSREPGAVLATLGTSTTLPNKPDVIDWLCTKETWLYPDNDKAGNRGKTALAEAIKSKNPDARVFAVEAEAFDDPGGWAEQTPFVEIERYDFDEKSGIFFDSGLAWGEANRMAVQTLNGGRESNEQ